MTRKRARQAARPDGNVAKVGYTPEVAREICERIARGEQWTKIANTGGLPSVNGLYRWRDRHPMFAEALAQAQALAREGWDGAERPAAFERLLETGEPPPAGNPRFPRKQVEAGGVTVAVSYTPELGEEICERIAEGEAWEHFCNRGRFPSNSVLWDWRKRYPEFGEAVEEARRAGAEARFERALGVAETATPATVTADKLHVDILMRQAAILDPERFSLRRAREPGQEPIRRITIRRFERAIRADGTPYVRAIDTVQEVSHDG